jgi:aminopeptidase N
VLAALKSFVDQQGVPVIRVERTAGGLSVAQKRYALLGTDIAPESWTIPLCLRVGADRQCTLLDGPGATVAMTGKGSIMPNAGGTGYYRFSLPEKEWHALIADAATLAPGEALALNDSLWADFRAGQVDPALLVEAAKAMVANPYSTAAVEGGQRLAGLRARGLIAAADVPAYRRTIEAIYAPALAKLGFDPKAGAYDADDPDRQQLRTNLVGLVAGEALDKDVRAKLTAAATAYLGGDKGALDQALLDTALGAYVGTGPQAVSALFERGAASDDTLFRDAAMGALGGSGDLETGRWMLAHIDDARLRPSDRLGIIRSMASEPETLTIAFDWLVAHYDALVKSNGIFVASGLPGSGGRFCSVKDADRVEAALRPKVDQYKRGALTLDRTVEQVHSCGVLEQARGGQIAAAFKGK